MPYTELNLIQPVFRHICDPGNRAAESAPIVEVETPKEDPAPIVEESTIVSANEKEETKKIFMKSAEAELEEMLQDSK